VKSLKGFVKLAIFIGLVLGYLRWPHYAVRKFAAAVNSGDTKTVASMVDLEAFRESTLRELTSGITHAQAKTSGYYAQEHLRRNAQDYLKSDAGQRMVENHLHTDALLREIVGNAGQVLGWKKEGWEGPLSYSIQDPGSDTKYVFHFRGWHGWKLCALEMSTNDWQKQLR
jgi:hypothetical protein